VTFLFTDIEESTQRWDADASATEALVASHDRLVRTVVEGHGGYVFASLGDGFGVAFARASDAVAAAVELQTSFARDEPSSNALRVRMGVHTGEAVERDGDYFGPTVNRTARIMALAYGGQIVLSAATAALIQGFDTVDLGEYQLRGLSRPERLHQVIEAGLARDFPPLQAERGPAHNLPAALTSFVGRRNEIEALAVRVSEARLVTLVGPGGAGKTRLAIEGTRRLLARFPDGVWLAELAVLRDPAQVATTVAQAMGHHDPLADAGGPGLVGERLAAAIGDQRILLVIDNCEHVIGAAADLVADLLGLCPRLVVVATSRQSLGVAGERLVEVGALDLPASDDVAGVAGSEAGALFVDRAQAVHPRFTLNPPAAAAVALVCRRLDGLPLAIELAAARVRLLTTSQIANRLDEALGLLVGGHSRAERHQTMRAALVWSYDLLTEAEQGLFRRLAVFRSSFILEAAAAVAPGGSEDIPGVLGGLVDKSLVAAMDGPAGERRFRLLEAVRQYAAGLLEASGEQDDAARRHRDHLLSRMPTPGDVFDSAGPEGIAAEFDNLRGAVEHAVRTGAPEAAVALMLAYWWWWENLGLVDEQLDLLEAALGAADPARMSPDVLSAALSQASTRATYLCRLDEAAAFAGRLAVLRDHHPESLAVRANWAFALATLTWYRAGGDRPLGNRLMRASQDAAEKSGLPLPAAYAAGNIPLAAILWDSVGDPDVTRAIRDSALLAERAEFPNMAVLMRVYDRVIQVMAGAIEAYPAGLDAFTELDALDRGWLAEWGGLAVGLAAELVGDQPVAARQARRFMCFCRQSGVRIMLTCGIRSAARLAAAAGYPAESLPLWAGAAQLEAATGAPYLPLWERLDRPLRRHSADALGSHADRLLAEGASWSIAGITGTAEDVLLRLQGDPAHRT
jgi:predicted ATPase